MTLSININPGASVNGGLGVGIMTSAGNPWAVADALATELVNRRVATFVSAAGLAIVSGVIHITGNLTITAGLADLFNTASGVPVVFDGAYTVTIQPGVQLTGFVFKPPGSGNATIAGDGTVVKLNDATTAITRALSASQRLCAVIPTGQDAYEATGA